MPRQPGYESRKTRQGQESESFRPHQRYPRLNANAGTTGERAEGRTARPASRRPVPTRSSRPAARIRLESSYELPPVSQARRSRSRARARSQGGIRLSSGRVVSLIGLLLALALGYWLLNSSTFNVSRVELKGNHYLTVDEVIKATGATKSNVFLLNEAEISKSIQKLPYVVSAKVSKGLPDHLTVEVTERKPSLNWKVSGMSYLVDPEGVVLEEVFEKDLPPEDLELPVIQSLEDRKLKAGDRVDPVAVRSSQTIQNQLTEAGFKLAAIQYSSGSGLIVLSAPESGNWKALLGTDAQLDKKISILKSLLADKSLKWSYADLRFVNKPVIS